MDNTLPGSVASGLIALIVISLIVFIFIPAIIAIQHFLRKATLEEMPQYESESSYESIVGACIGIVIIDVMLYVMERPVLPRDFFYAMLGIINFVVLSFVAYHLINRLLIRIRTRMLAKQA
ncbi:MAG TPA: hypothetical protein VGN34_13135 [Ktedonobacteraceae bacterium]